MTPEHIAGLLRAAYRGPIIAPLRDGPAVDDIEGGYVVQAINPRIWKRAALVAPDMARKHSASADDA